MLRLSARPPRRPWLTAGHASALAACLAVGALLISCDSARQGADASGEPVAGSSVASTAAQAIPSAWRAVFEGAQGQGAALVQLPGQAQATALTPGQALPAGSTIRTDERATVRLRLDHGGQATLNRSSDVTLLADAPGLMVHRGHVVLRAPEPEAAPTQDAARAPVARLKTPTGVMELDPGARVSTLAQPHEGSATVAAGRVRALDADGASLDASFGQRLVFPKEGGVIRLHAPELAESFGWSDLEGLDHALPQPELGMGKLVAKRPGQSAERPLILKDHAIKVRIQGMMAYTEITEVFHNPTGDRLEGLYRFPLPKDAQISRLALKVGDRIMEGQFLENARAERIWNDVTIVREQDPALLKWQQGSQFELKIFPIEPRSARQVTIGYVQRLERTSQGYSYTYPMPVDKTGQAHAERFSFEATLVDHDMSRPLDVRGYDGVQITQGVDEHDRAVSTIKLERSPFAPSGSLVLAYGLRQEHYALHAYTFEDKAKPQEPAYLALAIRPELEAAQEVAPRDFVLVVDRSYSQRGASALIQQALVQRLVRELDPLDRVRVITCAERCQSAGPMTWQRPDEDAALAITEALKASPALGSTHLVESMRSAARLLEAREDRSRQAHVIMLTDGVSSAGALDPGRLGDVARRLFTPHRAQLSLVSVGGDEDAVNLRAIAAAAGGQVVSISPEEGALAGALRVLRHHYGAALRQAVVELPPGVEQIYPREPVNLLPGQELLLVGRLKAPVSGQVRLRGVLGQAPFEASWPVTLTPSQAKGNAFVPRLWAKHHIEALERSAEGSQAAKREIVALSARFGILTRYTSLLALEDEQMMRDYQVSHQRHIQWRGDEAPEADAEIASGSATGPASSRAGGGGVQSAAEADAPAPAKRADTKASSAKDMGRAKGAPSPSNDLDDLPRPSRPREPPPMAKRRMPYCTTTLITQSRPAQPQTDAQRRALERRLATWRRDESNRTHRLAYIRALIGADAPALLEAEAQIEAWLQINAADPEAVALRGQLHALRGRDALGLRWLASAADQAARASWIQTRLRAAYEAIGDEAMRCAHQVSLDEITQAKKPLDPLSCPLASPAHALFEGASPEATPQASLQDKPLTGKLVASASWQGGQDALDLVLVEPSGRPLWWLEPRRDLQVRDVRAAGRESLALRSLPSGAWSLRAIRRQGVADGPIPITLTLRLDGKTQTLNRTLDGDQLELVEVIQELRRSCR